MCVYFIRSGGTRVSYREKPYFNELCNYVDVNFTTIHIPCTVDYTV